MPLQERVGYERKFLFARLLSAVVPVSALALCAFIWNSFDLTARAALFWVYERSFYIGIASLAWLVLLVWVMDRWGGTRPFLHVPFEASWWEYTLFGLSGGFVVISFCVIVVGALFILPVVVPLRLLFVYTFGAGATPVTAVVSFLAIGACTSFLFSFLYLLAMQYKWGGLLSSVGGDLTGHIGEVFHFSILTLLSSSPTGISSTGVCRWLVLIELIIGKLLEIIVIGAGLSLLLEARGGGS